MNGIQVALSHCSSDNLCGVDHLLSDVWLLLGTTRDDLVLHASAGACDFDDIDGRTYGELRALGISLLFEADRVSTVQLYGAGNAVYAKFAGALPARLRFDMSRGDVRRTLGRPVGSAEPRHVHHFGRAQACDRFDHRGLSIHVQYGHGEKAIQLVSLSIGRVE